MKMNKTLLAGAAFALASLAPIAMAAQSITVKGSDTMVILAQRWAEKYMAAHPDVTIQVTGGGSGTGISALINGTTDICNASRKMKAAERDKLKQRFSSLGVEIAAARDGLGVYLHESSPVTELTLDQVKAILHQQDHQLEGSGRSGRENRALRTREQFRHLRLFPRQRSQRR